MKAQTFCFLGLLSGLFGLASFPLPSHADDQGAAAKLQPLAAEPYRPLLTLDLLGAFRGRWSWPSELGQELRLGEPVYLLAPLPAPADPHSKVRAELVLGDPADPENGSLTQIKGLGEELLLADLLSGKSPNPEGTIDEPFMRARWRLFPVAGQRLLALQLDDLWLGPAGRAFLAQIRLAVSPHSGAAIPFTLVDSVAPGIHLALETDRAGNVFTAREAPVLRLRAFGVGPEPGAAPCRIRLCDRLTSQTVETSATLALSTGAAVQDLPLALPALGVWEVRAEAQGTSASTRVCLIPEPLKERPDSSPFGMNLFQQQLWSYSFDLPLLAKAGVKWIRPWLAWENTWALQEQQPGQPDWTQIDAMLNRCDELGLRYLYMLYGAPKWLHPGVAQPWSQDPRENQEWVDYARRVAQRYGARIPVWEHWNEPWGPPFTATGAHFEPLARALNEGVRAAAPQARQLGLGGTCTASFLEDYVNAGGLKDCDAIASHLYYGRKPPEDPNANLINDLAAQRDVLLRAGRPEMPLWLNETGYSANDFEPAYAGAVGVSEVEQAQYLVREYLLALSTGYVEKVFWFCSLDPRDPSMQRERPTGDSAIGLLYQGYTPKIAYGALATLCRQMGSPRILGQLTTDKPVVAYAWDVGGEPVVTAWSTQGPARLTLAIPASGVRAVNMMGNPVPVEGEGGRLNVPLNGSPLYLRGVTRGQLGPLLVPWRLDAPHYFRVQAGVPKTLTLSLSQATRPYQYSLKSSAPAEVTITSAPATISLKPGEERVLTLQVRSAKDELLTFHCDPPQGDVLPVRLANIATSPVYAESFKDNPLTGRWSSTNGDLAGRLWEAESGPSRAPCVHLERRIGAWQGLVSAPIAVKPNTRYVYSVFGKYQGTNALGARALVRDLVNNQFFDGCVLPFTAPEWTSQFGVFTTPANTDKIGLRLELPGADPFGDGWFTNLFLAEAPE